jgi:hypothetical protein
MLAVPGHGGMRFAKEAGALELPRLRLMLTDAR